MITEQELKAMCTPDIIKKMVELAEGFEIRQSISCSMFYFKPQPQVTTSIHTKDLFDSDNTFIFSTLIHRTCEGWNKLNSKLIISVDNRIIYDECGANKNYAYKNYQPENLTQLELALLHCLIEIFKSEVAG
jgi:hypothetical protein